jgi:hypothetical protein
MLDSRSAQLTVLSVGLFTGQVEFDFGHVRSDRFAKPLWER